MKPGMSVAPCCAAARVADPRPSAPALSALLQRCDGRSGQVQVHHLMDEGDRAGRRVGATHLRSDTTAPRHCITRVPATPSYAALARCLLVPLDLDRAFLDQGSYGAGRDDRRRHHRGGDTHRERELHDRVSLMFDDDAADIALVDQLLNASGKVGAADSFLGWHDIASSSVVTAHPPTAPA